MTVDAFIATHSGLAQYTNDNGGGSDISGISGISDRMIKEGMIHERKKRIIKGGNVSSIRYT